MNSYSLLKLAAKLASKSPLLKKFGNKFVVHLPPKEVETKIGSSRFIFRPKVDGLWYLNYSDAEPGVDKVLYEHLKKGDVFVDVGAYIGYYSILACEIVGELGKVVSFEPNPEAYRILKKNIELNGYKNCIAENVALSDEKSSLKLFIGRSTDGSSSLFLVDEVNKKRWITIETMTLDEYCENNKIYPNLIKIDAEGAEFKILRGMQKVLDRFHPKLLIEVHPKHLEKQGISLQSFFNFLLNHNYKIYLVERGGFEALNLTDEFSTYLRKGRINEYGTQINLHIFCRGIRQ